MDKQNARSVKSGREREVLMRMQRTDSSLYELRSTSRQALVYEIKNAFGKKANENDLFLLLSGSFGKKYHTQHYSDVDILVVNMENNNSNKTRFDLARLGLITATTKEVITKLSEQHIYIIAFPQAATEAVTEDLGRYTIANKLNKHPRDVTVEMLQCLFYPTKTALLEWEEPHLVKSLFANGEVVLGNAYVKENIVAMANGKGNNSDWLHAVHLAETDIANSYIFANSNVHLPSETLVKNAMRSSKAAALKLAESFTEKTKGIKLESFNAAIANKALLPDPLYRYVELVSHMRNISPFDTPLNEIGNLHVAGEEAVNHIYNEELATHNG